MFSDGTEAPTDTQVAVASKDEVEASFPATSVLLTTFPMWNIHEDPLEFEPWRFSESGKRREYSLPDGLI